MPPFDSLFVGMLSRRALANARRIARTMALGGVYRVRITVIARV